MDSNITVLFVDDDEMNCKVFKRYFSKISDIEILTALSAENAIELLKQAECTIKIIISDQRMPQTKGHQLLDHCRTFSPEVFRVLTSANQEEVEALFKNPELTGTIQEYIAKPWDFKQILEVIYSAVR